MSKSVITELTGIDLMILDALRHHPHPTHLSLQESVKILKRIAAKKSYITHIGHDLEHEDTLQNLPPGISVPFDGLMLEV